MIYIHILNKNNTSLERELKYEGCEVEKVFGGVGLVMVKAGPFDLVLLDIMLPGLNGIEVLGFKDRKYYYNNCEFEHIA